MPGGVGGFFAKAEAAIEQQNRSGMLHEGLLEIGNASWTKHLGYSAAGFGIAGGVIGGMSDDSSFMSGATTGAMWGVAKGAANKYMHNLYARGAESAGMATKAADDTFSTSVAANGHGFKFGHFTGGDKGLMGGFS